MSLGGTERYGEMKEVWTRNAGSKVGSFLLFAGEFEVASGFFSGATFGWLGLGGRT